MVLNIEKVGERIHRLRKREKLTMKTLADQLYISVDHLRGLEHGRHSASIDLFIEIADYFDVSLDYLLLGREHAKEEVKAELDDVIERLMDLRKRM